MAAIQYTPSGLPVNQTFNAQGQPTSDVNGNALSQQPSGLSQSIATSVPAPTVLTSEPARTATGQNLSSLQQAETALTQGNAVTPLQQTYGSRPDLQALYNPDG